MGERTWGPGSHVACGRHALGGGGGALKKASTFVGASNLLSKGPGGGANRGGEGLRKNKDAGQKEHGGLSFVYPHGSTLNVQKPAAALLSSGYIPV